MPSIITMQKPIMRPWVSAGSAPTAPTVSASRIDDTTIRFTFTGGSGATSWTGYYRTPDGSGSYTSESLSVGQAYSDVTVSSESTADYYVAATNAAGTVNSSVATGSAASTGISSITGTIADGSTVTVNGAGFGSMDGDVLTFAYGDESTSGAINGSTPTIGSLSTYVIGIGADTAGAHLLYSTANPRTGRSASLRRRHFDTGGTYRAGGFGPSNVHQPELFFSFWRYSQLPGGWSASGKNYKIYYIFGNGDRGDVSEVPQPILHVPAGSNSFVMGANLSGSDSNVGNSGGWNATNCMDAWQRWDNWIKINSDYGVQDGEFAVARDCVTALSDSSFSWFGPDADWVTQPTHFEDVRIGYMDLAMDDFIADYSDLYVASTRARVELGDASTWSACTHREIQLARESNWADGVISGVVLNLGSFASFSGTYLYVVGSDGNPISTTGYLVA